jgi:phosphate transport system permease protein
MSNWHTPEAGKRLKRRYAAERRFKTLGLIAILISLAFLAFLLVTMAANGVSGINWSFLSVSGARSKARS